MNQTPDTQSTARTGAYYGWWVVTAAAIGMSTGPGQFAFGSLGLFMLPLNEEFGWSRSQISLASTFFTLSLALTMPYLGHLVDRFGSRIILFPSILICAALLAAIPLLADQLWILLLLFILMGSLGAGANALPYLRVISAWFDRRRGLAIGIAMGGSGLGFAYVPPMLQAMIDNFGWRSGYYLLAVLTILIAIPLVYFFLHENPPQEEFDRVKEKSESVPLLEADTHFVLSEILKRPLLWQLFFIFCLLSFSLYGVLAHLVPMLVDRGMSSANAAMVQFTLGMGVVASRIIVGYIVDRVFAPYVAVVCFIITGIGISILAMGSVGAPVFIAATLIGLSMGAEIDLLAFLTSRYFGVENFGRVYGILFMSFLIGTSLGPLAYGAAYETYGSYRYVLILCIILIGVCCVATALLPKYAGQRKV